MSASYTEGRTKTFRNSSTALGRHLRVKLNGGTNKIELAGDEADIGTLDTRVEADAPAAVILNNAQGTRLMVAAGVVAVGAEVFAVAGGKVDDAGTKSRGTALTSAAADGDIIEVLPA